MMMMIVMMTVMIMMIHIRELILSRQKGGRSFKETEFKDLPELVRNFHHSLRVLIVESGSVVFDQKIARSLQKALSETSQLELLKLEAEESPYLHWVNSRYQVILYYSCEGAQI